MTRAIMIQGTGSNVGKSVLVAGLCRLFARRGFHVRPFKPQNMSNNAAVTPEGGEIGRAQALQARAARVAPHTDMNPVLLKPESDTGAQVIVQGKCRGRLGAQSFLQDRGALLELVLESFARLCRGADLVIVEGAGSPAETNLRQGDIANMGFACAVELPVLLAGDIDRGGVIAQIVGTRAVLDQTDNSRIKGFLINRFRGDPSLFDQGVTDIKDRTGWPCLGVLPWFDEAWRLPAEDVLDLTSHSGGTCRVVVPHLPRIANFDDLDPLAAEPCVDLQIVPRGQALPGNADLILLPGSKSTLSDLAVLRDEGWDIDILAHHRRGGHVLGLCGGYQMLGKTIADPKGVDGPTGQATGLGLLDIDTVMTPRKELALRSGYSLPDRMPLTGYEIHMGRTRGADTARSWLEIDGQPAGATSVDGRVRGCYLHGLFASDAFRSTFLGMLGHSSTLSYEQMVDETLDRLADHLADHLDTDRIWDLASEPVAR